MATSFENFAAWRPGPKPASPQRAADADAQQRWEGEGGNNNIRQHRAAADPVSDPEDGLQPDLGRLYASYVQAWRARFGTPAPFASARSIRPAGEKTKS